MSDIPKRFHCTACPRSFATLEAKEKHRADVHSVDTIDEKLHGLVREKISPQMRQGGILRR